jgi:Cu/Ag efflux protein CusF
MKPAHGLGPILPAALLVLAGCTGGPPSGPTGLAAGEYEIKGKIVAVDPGKPAVTLDHEDIPGLMIGMEMEFGVTDPKLVEGLKPGDPVQGRLKKSDSGYVITQLEKR